jgi:HlyD family secretion protein
MSSEPEPANASLTVVKSLPTIPAATADPNIASEFQPDAIELEERVPPRTARITIYSVTALLAAILIWATFSQIDEIVVAKGKLITTQPTIMVQPLETSIVRTLEVSPGDVVKAGQVLATLDATFSQSDVDQRQTEFNNLDAQVKRMEAELHEVDYVTVAGQTADEQLQLQLFRQRRAYHKAQLENFDEQINGQASAIESSKAQEVILVSRRETLAEMEAARQKLFDRETGTLMNLLSSRDARLAVDSTLAQLQGSAASAAHAVAKLRADRQAFIEDFNRETMETLVERKGRRDTIGEELKKMELRRDMIALTSPADAVVLDLAQRSIGSVVKEAEPIVTLVPLNSPIEVEVSIDAQDIGRVAAGDVARIKYDAYPFQKFGTTPGTIRTVSRDAFTPPADGAATKAVPFYKARIELGPLDAESPIRRVPGMTVTAELKVGRRSVISYFLYPIVKGLDTSLREP